MGQKPANAVRDCKMGLISLATKHPNRRLTRRAQGSNGALKGAKKTARTAWRCLGSFRTWACLQKYGRASEKNMFFLMASI